MFWFFGLNRKKEKQNKEDTQKKVSQKSINPQSYVSDTNLPFQLTFLSFHTANKLKRNICYIMLMYIENNKVECKYFPVKPSTKTFSQTNYHGISAKAVASAPTFVEVFSEIKPYIENKNVAFFHIPFHFLTFKSACEHNNIEIPNMKNIYDIYNLSYEVLPNLDSHSLNGLAEYFYTEYDPSDFSSILNINLEILEYAYENKPKLLKNFLNRKFSESYEDDEDDENYEADDD